MITGIYIRICRDGKWQSLDIAECTRAETLDFLKSKEKDWLINMLLVFLNHEQEGK